MYPQLTLIEPSVEHTFEAILPANIVGTFNLYEAAHLHGVKRIDVASSNRVNGFHKQGAMLGADSHVRTDGCYGLSKAFGENLTHFYWDRYGIETVSVRIGSCVPEPIDRPMLAAALAAPKVDHTVIFGISDNPAAWWDNRTATHIGYRPQGSAEPYRAAIEALPPAFEPAAQFQGGVFVTNGPFE